MGKEAHSVPNKLNQKRHTQRHSKVEEKEKILKVARKNNLSMQGKPYEAMSIFLQWKHCRPEGSGVATSKY